MSNDEAYKPNGRTAPDSTLRVLYVAFGGSLVGGANFALLAMMLDMKRRYNVEPVLLANLEGNFTEECRKNGIEVITVRYYGWFYKGKAIHKGFVKELLNRLYSYRKLLRLLRNQHFTIVHTNTSGIQTGDIIAQHFGIPHIWHIREHGIADHDTPYTYPDSYVRSRFALSAANVTVSKAIYDNLVHEQRLMSPANSRVIYDGVKIPEAYSKKYTHGGVVNFCIVGTIFPGKNQLMAIKACAKLRVKTDKFMLHIIGQVKAGSDAKYGASLKEYVSSHGLESAVKFWGFSYKVNEILRDMDVGLMLSKCEGFGLVTAEYMMNYMPVIGVDTGSTPELVRDGENGFICPFDDSDTLAELMYRFIADPELLRTLGNNGRQIAVRDFSLERNTDEIYALYQEILNRK